MLIHRCPGVLMVMFHLRINFQLKNCLLDEMDERNLMQKGFSNREGLCL